MALTVVKTSALSGTITNAQLAGSIDLTSKVTGTLPTGNGGTGSTATTFVNMTSNVTGTLPAANGGTGATSFSPAKIVQMQHTKNTTYRNVTTDSFVSCITVTITPTSSSNTILVFGACYIGAGAVDTSVNSRLIRVVSASDVATQVLNDITGYSGNSERFEGTGSAFQWHDSPATTSAVTYDYRICSVFDISGVHYNNYLSDGNQSSQITAMEISA